MECSVAVVALQAWPGPALSNLRGYCNKQRRHVKPTPGFIPSLLGLLLDLQCHHQSLSLTVSASIMLGAFSVCASTSVVIAQSSLLLIMARFLYGKMWLRHCKSKCQPCCERFHVTQSPMYHCLGFDVEITTLTIKSAGCSHHIDSINISYDKRPIFEVIGLSHSSKESV